MSGLPESNHSGQSPQHEKNGSAEGSVKRRRIALACLDCRRRKLKCDRIYPACSRCQKAGHPDTCTYDPNAIDSLNERPYMDFARGNRDSESHSNALRRHPDPNYFGNHQPLDTDYGLITGMQSHIDQLESRIIGLERAVNLDQQRAEPPNPKTQYGSPKSRREDKEFMTFRGKNYKTAFYGATHDTSTFNHVSSIRSLMSCSPYVYSLHQLCSLKPFMKEMMVQHPVLVQMQKKFRGSKVSRPAGDNSGCKGNLLYMYLPSRPVADRLLEMYISSFEKTYRVLHLPSFRSEYTGMWEDLSNARPLFVSLVLLILASMNCMVKQEQPSFRGDSSSAREMAIGWIEACDSFLETQSQKHITLNYLQARIVSFIAKSINGVKKKRAWTTIGTLMSFAVSAGLHRDVECLNQKHGRDGPRRRVSYFDQEMRRRLWSTISELELQSAIERGMPASLPDLPVDCGPPCNCEDEDIDPGMEYEPRSRPVLVYTPSSFLHHMSTSWDMRRSLVSSINGAGRPLDHHSVLRYDRMIRKALDGIPPWNGADSDYSTSLMQVQLQQFLTFVHRPLSDTGLHQGFGQLGTEQIGAAQTIIDLHYRLWQSGNYILLAFREDLLGVGLTICHALESALRIPGRSCISYHTDLGLTDYRCTNIDKDRNDGRK